MEETLGDHENLQNLQSFSSALENQLKNFSRPSINLFFSELYKHISEPIANFEKILEVGAGYGSSKLFLQHSGIVRTDYLQIEQREVLGEVDVLALPFPSSSFESVFGVDFLHHISDPHLALSEMRRVLSSDSGSKIILIEPYVSLFSYIPYKLFHHEKTSLPFLSKKNLDYLSADPSDADQTLARWVFMSKRHSQTLFQIFPENLFEIKVKLFSFLSFFATGGLTKPLPTSRWIIKQLIELEDKFPKFIMKYLASRMCVQITRIGKTN